MEKNSKIFVAGHKGLVGSAICKALEKEGYTNILKRTKEELDLTDQTAVAQFFSSEKPDYVFLAAARVGGIHANNVYRAEFIYDNLSIQNNIINSSYRNGVTKLLFLGSTCIYPKKSPQPMQEDYLLTSELEYTNEPYAIAKIAGIKMCESYNIQYGTNYISVMPTNLYGPNNNFHLFNSHVIPAMIRKVYLGKLLEEGRIDDVVRDMKSDGSVKADASVDEVLRILADIGVKSEDGKVFVEIWGTGTPRREFLWSEDLAEACVYIMQNVNFGDVSNGQQEIKNTHINIGTGVDISIRELAETVKAAVGLKGDLYFNSDKPDGTPVKLTDVSKLHSLGWKHKVELNEGIERLYGWYKNKMDV